MRGLLLLLALAVAALVTIAEPLGPRAELAKRLDQDVVATMRSLAIGLDQTGGR